MQARRGTLIWGGAALVALGIAGLRAQAPASPQTSAPDAIIDPAPTPRDWAAIGQLPDWSGVWSPDIPDQVRQVTGNPMPWNAVAAPQIAEMEKEEKAGRPRLVLYGCFPHGMPSWILIGHDAMELLFTPGRVTMLGEGDGNRIRRIYTDGRPHADDPDLSFHGNSIGHWEGQTLVIDTIGVLPQAPLAVSESVGLPNNGGMHIRERLSLAGASELRDEIEITAPKLLTRPYTSVRKWYRQRKRAFEVQEGICQQGMNRAGVDARGNAVFTPQKMDAYGIPITDGK